MFESAKEALEDLLSIEINTIRKAGMTARRPPMFPWQLKEIIDSYTHYLEKLGICTDLVKTPDSVLFGIKGEELTKELEKIDKPDENGKLYSLEDKVKQSKEEYLKLADINSRSDKDTDTVTNGWTTFEKLRILAKQAYNGNIPGIEIKDEELRIMLVRIRRNCDLIKAILKDLEKKENGLKDFINVDEEKLIENLQDEKMQLNFKNVQLSQITTVRKIWEIGIESVLIQTVIQAEGDVITRITPDLVDRQNIAEMREAMLTVHRNTMDIGLLHWKNLIGVVLELASKIITGK
ncbi:MAG: hypothetical protein ACXWT1_06120 [Methylobacter sp.]